MEKLFDILVVTCGCLSISAFAVLIGIIVGSGKSRRK